MDHWISAAEQMLFFCRDRQKRTIAFVAPYAGSGVSTLTRAVAEIAVQSGYRPILIDLSRPARLEARPSDEEHATFHPVTRSISDALWFDHIDVRLDASNKYFFNNAGWLRQRFEQLVGNYDLALIDLPAILDRDPETVNPLSILHACDGVLLVCEPGRVSGSALAGVLEQIRIAGTRVDGIVINEGRRASVAGEIISVVRRLFAFAPRFAARLERRIRASPFFN